MNIISFFSNIAVPFVIFFIILYGISEKIKVFDVFLIGCKEGIKITLNILPTLIGLFVAISSLRHSGVLEFIINLASPLLSLFNFPPEIMPLAILRPISGSGSIAIATDIMKTFGVDSLIGNIASTIMGSTETTLYTIAVYTSCVKIKKTRFILLAALTADIVGICSSIILCRIVS